MGTVSFPGLGLEFHLNRVAFHIGSWPVYWYGIIIAAGFLLAVCTAMRPSASASSRTTSSTCSFLPCPCPS